MSGDSGIDSILITHPDRVARQQGRQPIWFGYDPGAGDDYTVIMHIPPEKEVDQVHESDVTAVFIPALNDVDLAQSYVPFDKTNSHDAESDETMFTRSLPYILGTGLLLTIVLLVGFIAQGHALTSHHGASHVQKAR